MIPVSATDTAAAPDAVSAHADTAPDAAALASSESKILPRLGCCAGVMWLLVILLSGYWLFGYWLSDYLDIW